MAIEDFRCVTRFRVPFHDCDMMQHVNHANYVVWSETARCVYFEEVFSDCFGGTTGIIVAHIEFDYERPIDFRDDVAVGCRISRLGSKSFDFAYEIWNEGKGFRAARGLTTVVAYDYDAKAPIAIPQRWRDLVAAYESVAPIAAV